VAAYRVNKAGSLALGGTFGAGIASLKMSFAKIHGKENSELEIPSGYLAFGRPQEQQHHFI
jgi:hypothetical protein